MGSHILFEEGREASFGGRLFALLAEFAKTDTFLVLLLVSAVLREAWEVAGICSAERDLTCSRASGWRTTWRPVAENFGAYVATP